MANPKAQVPDDIAATKAAAQSSNSVQALRDAVAQLADEVMELRARVTRLEGRR